MSSQDSSEGHEFDYVIVGGGTAGCVIASRLSESPDTRVCLIEAGGSERHPFISVPAAVGAAISSDKFSWGLTSTPQAHLGGRKIPLPRGRVLGGSGSINGMAYYRGPAIDFDGWQKLGNPGWSYAHLLPYFLRSEDNIDYPGSAYHATGGPMQVAFPPSRNPLCEAFNTGMSRAGFRELPDFNVPDPDGYGYRQGTLWRGRRVSTASAFARPAMRRPNLNVMLESQVTRVLLDGKQAVGVEAIQAGRKQRIRARREVVICAGAFHSPHLLMHSGIGAGELLARHGITPAHELPAVGRHLKDHPASFVAMETRDPTSYGLSWRALSRNIGHALNYALRRRGPIAGNLFETNAYIRSDPALDRPDLQIVFQPARRNRRPFPIPIGHGYAISVVCLYPQSEGSVTPAGPDPLALPVIDPALGANEADLNVILAGMRLARQVLADSAFAGYAATEVLPGPATHTDQQWLEHIRATLATVHHPACTCRMGPAGATVVDPELRVHGLTGLRVADASVFPSLVGANTNAAVVAVAEKAADLLRGLPAPAPLDPGTLAAGAMSAGC